MGISEQKLYALLQKVLGEGKIVSKDEAMFVCPFSHHRKPKLSLLILQHRDGKVGLTQMLRVVVSFRYSKDCKFQAIISQSCLKLLNFQKTQN